MTELQQIKQYLKERYPIGKEIYDSVRSGGPYVINKRTVFEIHRWKKEDYNPDFVPENPDKYYIEVLVKNPGKYSPNYSVCTLDMQTVKYYFSVYKKRNASKNKSV